MHMRPGPIVPLLAVCALVGGGCGGGSSNPKISDASGFVKKCVGKGTGSSNAALKKLSADQLKQLCACTQKELVAKGDGDKGYGDPAVKDDGNEAALTCVKPLLRGY